MSITSEISRISQNVSDSLAAVAAKGVTVPTGSTSDDLATLIGSIEQLDISDTTAAAGDVLSGKYFYTAAGSKTQGTILTKTSSDLTASGATVTAPAGYYASAASTSVASGTAGTPTATKGSVSSHSITVTPSVTNTTGYITGGTNTGTAVTVSASELVSGTYTANANGSSIDITNYASLTVAIPVYDGTVT